VAVAVVQIGLSIPAVLNGFGRKRLLAIGAGLMAAGALLGFFTPGAGTGHGTRVAVLLTGQVLAGIGAAAILPTSIAMLAAGTHSVRARSHAISVWAAALTGAGFVSPLIGGLLARVSHPDGPEASSSPWSSSWRSSWSSGVATGRSCRSTCSRTDLRRQRGGHRDRHVRLSRHGLHNQHPALRHPGLLAAGDVDRVRLPQHHGRGAVPGQLARDRALHPGLGARRGHGVPSH
jgi:MFS family permease